MSKKFKISEDGLNLIKHFEGLRLHTYLCSAGVPTIGYGTTRHNGSPIRMGMVWTKKQAEDALKVDVATFERAVNNLVKVPITQKMFDALVCFAYNVGVGSLEKSTLLRLLNKKEYTKVPEQFLRWDKVDGKSVKGLRLRRSAESKLFSKGLDELKSSSDEDCVFDELNRIIDSGD